MMDLYVLAGGIPHSLTDRAVCWLLEQDGVGLPPLHRIAERGPQQDGESDRGFRLDPRIVSLVLAVEKDPFHEKRDNLVRWFKPGNAHLSLRWVRDDGVVRQLDCYYVDQMSLGTNVASQYFMKVVAQFKAPDPTFYNPDQVSIVFAVAVGPQQMDIPLAIPWKVGTSQLNAATAIEYAGTYRTYPIIKIYGPVTDCIIRNETTSEKLDFTNVTIAADDIYTIDLRYGQKTVKDKNGNNKVADLTNDSNLATWHLAEDPEAPDGINSIRVTGTSASSATGVTIQFHTRYLSL